MTTTLKTTNDDIHGNVPGYKGWCPACYWRAILKLCDKKGFVVFHNAKTFPPRIVDPLSRGLALSVRNAARTIVFQRTGNTPEAAPHAATCAISQNQS